MFNNSFGNGSLSSHSSTSTTYPSTTDLSVHSWTWESTLDSSWRDSGNYTDSYSDNTDGVSERSVVKPKISWISTVDNKNKEKFTIIGIKKVNL